MIRYQKRQVLTEMPRNGSSVGGAAALAFKEQWQLAGSHETRAWSRLQVFYITRQNPVAPLGFLGRSPWRILPVTPFRIRSLGEIEIPECRGDEFSGMVVDADHSSAFRFQLLGRVVEFFKGLRQCVLIVQRSTHLVAAHAVDIQQSSEPNRLFIDAHMVPFV